MYGIFVCYYLDFIQEKKISKNTVYCEKEKIGFKSLCQGNEADTRTMAEMKATKSQKHFIDIFS